MSINMKSRQNTKSALCGFIVADALKYLGVPQ